MNKIFILLSFIALIQVFFSIEDFITCPSYVSAYLPPSEAIIFVKDVLYTERPKANFVNESAAIMFLLVASVVGILSDIKTLRKAENKQPKTFQDQNHEDIPTIPVSPANVIEKPPQRRMSYADAVGYDKMEQKVPRNPDIHL